MFARRELIWDGLKVRQGSKRGRILAAIEPDSNWPGMWHVRHDDKLSAMANLSRAKDAAVAIALSELNSQGATLQCLIDRRGILRSAGKRVIDRIADLKQQAGAPAQLSTLETA